VEFHAPAAPARPSKKAQKIVDAARESRRPPFRPSHVADITRYCFLEVLK
jgi:hypothetical protein